MKKTRQSALPLLHYSQRKIIKSSLLREEPLMRVVRSPLVPVMWQKRMKLKRHQ